MRLALTVPAAAARTSEGVAIPGRYGKSASRLAAATSGSRPGVTAKALDTLNRHVNDYISRTGYGKAA
jgi:hypothetical protein